MMRVRAEVPVNLLPWTLRLRDVLKRGPGYHVWRRRLTASARWTAAELDRFRVTRLRALLTQAARAPYYREVFAEVGFEPARLQSVDELTRLPLLDKEIIRARPGGFDTRWPVPGRVTSTGGSSGQPLSFRQPVDALWGEAAFTDHVLAAHGWRPGDRMAVFRGGTLGVPRVRAGERLHLSGYHLDDESLRGHALALAVHRPAFIHCYPSLLDRLAAFMLREGLRLPGAPRAALCASEALHAHQRERIFAALGCPCIGHYGMSEQVALAVEDGGWFFLPQYGVVELVPVGEGLHEIVGTGFLNRAFPFVRYRTGDLVADPEPDSYSSFGVRGLRVGRLVGRRQEVVVARDGARVPFNHMVFSIHTGFWEQVATYQMVQDAPGRVVLRVVPLSGGRDGLAFAMRAELAARIGHLVDVEVEVVEQIAAVGRGKARWFRGIDEPTPGPLTPDA